VTVIEQDVNNDPIDNCNNLESIEFSEQELRLIDTRHYYIEELRSYGIEPQDYGRAFPNVIGYPLVPRKWEDTELEVVLQAAIDTSTAFQNIGNFSTSDPKAIFHIIMDNFTVVRVENNHSSASCSTPAVNDNACTDNNMSLIGFWGDIATNRTPIGFTKELVVHEFGHRFDNEVEAVTGTSFRSRVSDAVIRSDATPQNQRGALVMGVFVIENERQWSRGPRGWGTGWVVDAGGERQISRLQQSDFDTFDETAADMFLNWVYRYVDGTGFLNRSWNPLEENGEGVPCSQIEEGCPDGTNPGDARFNWMEEQFEEIFGEGSTW
jgi:hypothetical protein